MQLRDIAVFREQYEKTTPQSKSYYVSLWFMITMALFHIVLDFKTTLDISLSYKWVVLAILSLVGVSTFSRRILRKINMHVIYIFITCIFVPYSFFTSGGQYSFVQYFMIVYLVLIFFMMELKVASLYAIYNFIQLEVLYIIESQRPELVHKLTLDWLVLENAVTIPILMVVMIAILTIMLVLYKNDEEKIKKHNIELRRDAKLKNTMLEITYTVTQNYDREQLTQTILGRLMDAMENAEQGSLMKILKRKAYYDSAIGYDIEALRDVVIPVQETYLYRVTDGEMDRAVIITNSERMDLDEDKGSAFDQVKFFYNRSTLCSPILLHGKIWGILNIESIEGLAFSNKDKEFIRVFTNEIEKVLSFSLLLEQNQRLRNFDYLTGIMNRLRFTEVITDKMSRQKRDDNFAFISCDLDNFKNINDQYGHSHGDDYLKYFVAIVGQHLDEDDIFGRTGGDEFQILMRNKTTAEANEVMLNIRKEFAKRPVILKRNRIVLRFSYGIVPCYSDDTLNDVSIKSDQMLYRNKKLNKLNTHSDEWVFNI